MVSKFRLIKPLLFTGIFVEACFVYVVDERRECVCGVIERRENPIKTTLNPLFLFDPSTMTIFPNFVSERSMKKKEVRNEMNKIIGWL